MGAYLGIDLHRRRSLAVCLNEEGETLWWRRFENSPANLAGIIAERPRRWPGWVVCPVACP